MTPAPTGRIPKVARLMALAIKFDGMLRRGEVTDYAELVRLGIPLPEPRGSKPRRT